MHNEAAGEVTIFAVNRHLSESLPLDIDLRSFGDFRVLEHLVLESDDLKAANTQDAPDRVAPHARGNALADGSGIRASLGKASWNVIRAKLTDS